MSKIVAIMGSTNSKGDTASAVDAILDGAMGLSTNVIKYHSVGKLRLTAGCDYSRLSVDKVIDSDLKAVLDDIGSADAVIFATPLYFNFPTAQFMTVLHGLSYFGSDGTSKLAGKKAIVLITCDRMDSLSNSVLENMVSALETMGMIVVSRMIFSNHAGSQKFIDNKAAIDKAVKVGAKFYKTFDVEPDTEVVVLG